MFQNTHARNSTESISVANTHWALQVCANCTLAPVHANQFKLQEFFIALNGSKTVQNMWLCCLRPKNGAPARWRMMRPRPMAGMESIARLYTSRAVISLVLLETGGFHLDVCSFQYTAMQSTATNSAWQGLHLFCTHELSQTRYWNWKHLRTHINYVRLQQTESWVCAASRKGLAI